MAKKIIIFSGKQYSGKDTLAGIMLKLMPEFKRYAMGDVIKETYGKLHGISFDEIEKNKSIYRPELIALGDWGRNQDPDYWLKKIISADGNIFVTDVRLKHEYEIFKAAGAISIRVEAPREIRATRGTLVSENDLTETDLDNINDWDFIINNDKDLNKLTIIAQKLTEEILFRH